MLARGQNVMLGYYNNDEATEAVLQDRWLRTGDLGKLDEDGNLFIVGRSKDVIIDSNGKNIYPDEIEDLYGKVGLYQRDERRRPARRRRRRKDRGARRSGLRTRHRTRREPR